MKAVSMVICLVAFLTLLGAPVCSTTLSPAQTTSVSAADSTGRVLKSWFEKITLSGTLNGEFRWKRRLDAARGVLDAASDLYIRKMELGVETATIVWLSAVAVFNTEYLGDEVNRGDERLKIDEVHFDLRLPGSPFYFVIGKRTQPFGLFENYLLTDPMTYDAYSTSVVGATAGYTGPMSLDVSFTLYKGTVQMDQLFGSGLFDTTAVNRPPSENHLTNSYVASVALSPSSEYLTVFGAFLSEPASGRRDLSIDVGLALKTPGLENLLLDGEYIRAIRRETYQGLGRSYEEGVLSVTGSYQFVIRPRVLRGSGNYKNRRSYTRAHPFLVAGRFEYFDDDSLAETARVWTTKSRFSVGVKYTWFERGNVAFYGMTEYRCSTYRIPAHPSRAGDSENDEVYLRLAVDF